MKMLTHIVCLFALALPGAGHTADAVRDVRTVITTMVNGIDAKDWKVAREQFAPEVVVDYSSMTGQPGAPMASDQLVDGWASLLARVSTHHMLTNFAIEVEGDEAESMAHVYASHDADGIEPWDIFGRYHHRLRRTPEGWRIVSMTLLVHGQRGNTDFLADVSAAKQ